ncbi:MAG: putative metal-binding motif-containing protein [Archangium sp.]
MSLTGIPFTATIAFRPTTVGSFASAWTLKDSQGNTLATVTLRGEAVAATTCVDADGDGATTNCASATDCNDSNASIRPGAPEVCNGGIDDDCNPSTIENCGTDAGVDAGIDAGACTCTDDPTDCQTVAACVLDAGQSVCFNFALPDRTACTRSATDGGAGLCQTSQCVECINASDCTELNGTATVCDLVTCNAGRCESVRRHDNTSWKVTPPFTNELLISTGAVPLKAMWDGETFAVAYQTVDGGASVRRIDRAGVLGASMNIDPRVKDLAFSGDRFLLVTEEPAGGAYPFAYIGSSFAFYDGGTQQNGATIVDFGSTNSPADFRFPSVAGSTDGGFMVVATAVSFFWSKYVLLPSGTAGEITSPNRPRYTNVMGARNGYTLSATDLINGAGRAEGGAGFFPRTQVGPNPGSYNPVAIPFNAPTNPSNLGACCVTGPRLASNGNTFMYAYGWDSVQGLVRPFDANLQPGADRVYVNSNALYGASESAELHSDGFNFLLVELPTGQTLRLLRISPVGELLDTPPFDLTPMDGFVESKPKLVSDFAGRNLIAYQKTEGAQINTYARLFTTCP